MELTKCKADAPLPLQVTSFSVSNFQAQAGFDAEDNWLQTFQIDDDPSHTTLEQWLHKNGIRAESLERLCSSFQPAPARGFEAQPHHRSSLPLPLDATHNPAHHHSAC